MLSTKHILILPLGVNMSKLSPLTAEKLGVRQLSNLPKRTELNGIFLVPALALTKNTDRTKLYRNLKGTAFTNSPTTLVSSLTG